ncbi:hypothetical protein Trydic_g22994 [Trypoxylus dichotomus]
MEISCPAVNKQNDFPLNQYSCINKLVRIVAYIHRFKTNCLLSKANRQHSALTTLELNNAMMTIIKLLQSECFKKEMVKITLLVPWPMILSVGILSSPALHILEDCWRPLNPLSSDPNETEVLTPANFLIEHSFTTTPDHDFTSIPDNRLRRYQLLQKLTQHFWKKWSREHINGMQQRAKGRQTTAPLTVGMLVLIKEDNLLPARWKLGRITQVLPRADTIVRVVTVKCVFGEIRRPAGKVCIVPLENV